jgi:hypothetical protein
MDHGKKTDSKTAEQRREECVSEITWLNPFLHFLEFIYALLDAISEPLSLYQD